MFGKVNEDSFRSIFEGSLFDNKNTSPAHNSLFAAADFGSSNNKRRMPFQQLQQQQQNHGCIGDSRRQQQQSQLFPDNSLSLDLASLAAKNSKSSPASNNSSNGSQNNNKVNPNRYKTELCRPFQENGVCKYGEKCQFAHGSAELRTVSRHPKYKTDLCRTYHSVGFCPYGPRCHFIHNLEEVKPKEKAAAAVASPALQGILPPQLPVFGNSLTQEQLSRLDGGRRLRNPSESGYTSSGSSSSSSSSWGGDSGSEGSFSPVGAGSRLPVFSTLSK